MPRSQTYGKHWFSRPIAVSTVGALVGTLALATSIPAAAAETEFSSSFESGEPEPLVSEPFGDGPTNLTGDSYAEGSLLGLVHEVTGTDEDNSPSGELPPNAADGSADTKWLTREDTGTLTYELSEAASITGYALTSANDAPQRDPRDFTVQGSTDGEEWTDLDQRTDEAWEDGDDENRKTTTSYELQERSADYTYFRLEITRNHGGGDTQLAEFDLIDSDRGVQTSPLITEVSDGPSSSHTAKTGVGFSGTHSLKYSGQVVDDGDASATNVLFDDVDLDVEDDSQLTYKVFPELDSDLTYAATHVAVDLVFDDGTRLSDAGATDVAGYGADARSQGEGDILWPDQWNSVTIDLGDFTGKHVDQVLLDYDQPGAPAGTPVTGYLDDVTIDHATERDTSDGLISYVDTRRGTNSSGGFSRGNNLPATAWPNGFNFITPMTDANTHGTLYEYQAGNNSDNLPTLQGIGFSHEPSIWMGDRNQLAVLPADGDNPTSSLSDRELAFTHENEVARPDIYSVEFENGLETAVTPTDHGAIYRFDFTGEDGSVLLDEGDGSSDLTVSDDGSVTGWVEGGSGYPGRTRMFVAGHFDATPTEAGEAPHGDRDGARYAAFDTSEDSTVELRIATSFISTDQAEANLDLEVSGRSFAEVQDAVAAEWNDRLGVITDIEGATDEQLVNIYSGLYRLNLYPNSQFENTGTADDPVRQYASPVTDTSGDATDTETNAKIVDGTMYVNNGFWDTYRTAWPAYSLLYPEVTEDLVDGFVQQYRDGGWISRWSSPGYADLMTGTSSDVSFAEAYLAGSLSTDLALDAYDAAVKNATALPESNAVGRKGLDRSIFLGYTDASTHQSASWGLEGYINDFGIAQMAHALADDPETPADRVEQLQEEATYFDARSEHFVEMYNPEAGVFTGRNADGSWPEGEDFDKKEWGGAFTEASGWTFAFHAPHDVDGMAALYGGRQGLIDEIDDFLTTPEKADYSGIHEAREARDVRLGMLGMSNQVAHHIPYVLGEAGDVSGSQELIREITQRLFTGSDIGQGYPGDEDNGEMSAWYIFSTLGFYPLEVGSGDYTIGSPSIDGATLHLGGNDLRITAEGAGDGQTYVAGLAHDGEPLEDTTIDGDLLRSGGDLTFTMSQTPSQWGAKDLDEDLSVPETPVDATAPEFGTLSAEDDTDVAALVDDRMRSAVTFPGQEATVTWTSTSGPVAAQQYTLTSSEDGAAPQAWTLSGSMDGENWTELDSRDGQTFPFDTQTRPFSISEDEGSFIHYQLEMTAGEDATDDLAVAEWELFTSEADESDLEVSASADQRVQLGGEFTEQVATVIGADVTDADEVTVDYGDGAGPQEADLDRNDLGGWAVSAPHEFERPGVYSTDIVATDSAGNSATDTTAITVFREDGLTGNFNSVCIGVEGESAGDCDGQDSSYFRSKLADSGFVQGERLDVPGTEVSADLPDIPAGEPDNITNEGQELAIDLGEDATQISLIGTANEKNHDLEGTLTYADGSEDELPIQFGDWVGTAGSPAFGNIQVGLSQGRLDGTEPESEVKDTAIFATDPVDLAVDEDGEAKAPVRLTLPEGEGSLGGDGRVHIFALASDSDQEDRAPLGLDAAEVDTQRAGESFAATLATVTGGLGQDEVSAVVNWGDGSQVSVIEDVEDVIEAEHTYDEAGTYEVSVVADDGVASASTKTSIEVENDSSDFEPEISVDPEQVEPGAQVTVTGTGFAPEETVGVALGERAQSTAMAGDGEGSASADEDGQFSAQIGVPEDAADGTYPVLAYGEVSQVQAQAEVQVRAESGDPVATEVSLAASTQEPRAKESFQLTASLSPEDATGEVEFRDDADVVGTASVSGGSATIDLQAGTSGEHSYTAHFTPVDPAEFAESDSDPLVLTVADGPTGDDGSDPDGDDDAGSDDSGDSGGTDDSTGSDSSGGSDAGSDGSDDGSMPSTGADIIGWIVGLAGLLTAGGVVIALRNRAGLTQE